MSIIEVVLILALVFAIGVAIYSHTNAGKAELASLHTKLDTLGQTLHLVHAATIAPVSVVTVPQQPVLTAPPPVVHDSSVVPASSVTISGPHVNTFIENLLGRTPGTDAILNGRVANAPVGATIGPKYAFDAFDGSWGLDDFPVQTGVPVSVTGVPAAQGFTIAWYEVVGGTPCVMDVQALRNGVEVARSQGGGGNGGSLAVPGGGDVSVIFTAPVATKWGVAIKP